LRAKIISIGSYVPDKILSNHDLEKLVDTSEEWIIERTGIKERRIAAPGQAASDLALEASKAALSDAGIKPRNIDLIIVATATPDMPFPSTACILQDKLAARNAAAFDVSAVCSGFVYGLSVAEAYIKSGQAERILLVGTDVFSKFMDWEDRTTCVLFGDGAGAVLIEPTEGESGILSTDIHSDGKHQDLIMLPGGGSIEPPSAKTIEKKRHFIKMKGNETFKIAVKTLEKLVVDTLKKNNLKLSQLSLLIPHQANMRIIKATAKRLGLPMERVFTNLEKYGNTSAASVPMALDEAVRARLVREGDYVMLEAFGGGLTWASALIKW
jgi:3-oxoacyl-[acyl-carrier-protein] synthase-3